MTFSKRRHEPLPFRITQFCYVLFIALIFSGNDGVGAEWSITTKINQQFQVDDNPRLLTAGSDAIFGGTTSPESRYRYRSPILDINLYSQFDFARFSDRAFDSEDPTVRLESGYTQERSIWGLNALLERDATRNTEVTDTGLIEGNANRLRFSLQPSYGYQLSEIDVIRVNFGYTNVSYDTDTLINYTYWTLAGRWSRKFSERTSLDYSVNAARQEAENNVTSNFLGFNAQINHVFSPSLKADLSIGPRYSSQETASANQSSLGISLSTNVDYAWSQQTSLSASANQSVEPSGAGVSRNKRRLSFSAEHRYRPRLAFSFSLDYQNDSDVSGDDSSAGRTYFTVSPGFKWKMTQDWDLTGSYRFRRQEFSDGAGANSNVLFVTLIYHPISWFISR